MLLTNYSEPWQLGFQAAGSFIFGEVVNLHAEVLYILILILTIVFILLIRVYMIKNIMLSFSEAGVVEMIWTIMPGVILIIIGMPSLNLLYQMEEAIDVGVRVKTVGHQWYWSYEVQNFNGDPFICEFDSYMVSSEDLNWGEKRLLEVDNRLLLPIREEVSILVTAADVLHSFAVPSLGIKMDGVPGRLNQLLVKIVRPGVYYGQCSEICGVNHSFMPIVIEGVSIKEYNNWICKEVIM